MQISKLKWRCRKGLRELDILLTYFVEKHYNNLTNNEKELFLELLDLESQELLNIVLGRQSYDVKFQNLIQVITKKNKTNE
ncbi:MAG: succinate dehydrogenase assembly factor 2 [Gammaproteobacteria bacterium]|nr:succinate dehydrogenase assembly factor 2 [Gammaproteobacteria bacterium]|tara:strand:- start:2399 stop:2641 length:243 start_codon:yes stop_codon:yes gene_type:complete